MQYQLENPNKHLTNILLLSLIFETNFKFFVFSTLISHYHVLQRYLLLIQHFSNHFLFLIPINFNCDKSIYVLNIIDTPYWKVLLMIALLPFCFRAKLAIIDRQTGIFSAQNSGGVMSTTFFWVPNTVLQTRKYYVLQCSE